MLACITYIQFRFQKIKTSELLALALYAKSPRRVLNPTMFSMFVYHSKLYNIPLLAMEAIGEIRTCHVLISPMASIARREMLMAACSWSSRPYFGKGVKSFSSVASGIWNVVPNHLSSVPTLPVFRRALKYHLFLLAYPNSSAKSGMIKPAQCISLRDTVPTTAIAQPVNTMPPI